VEEESRLFSNSPGGEGDCQLHVRFIHGDIPSICSRNHRIGLRISFELRPEKSSQFQSTPFSTATKCKFLINTILKKHLKRISVVEINGVFDIKRHGIDNFKTKIIHSIYSIKPCSQLLNWTTPDTFTGHIYHIVYIDSAAEIYVNKVLSNKNKLMVHMYIVINTTIFLIVRLLLLRYNYMFRPSMLAIFRLHMKHLKISYIYMWVGSLQFVGWGGCEISFCVCRRGVDRVGLGGVV